MSNEIESSNIPNHDIYTELSKYVTTLTTNGGKNLDEALMKKIKQICRKSDKHVEYIYHLLMTQVRKEHSEIRYSGLLIANELFRRSHCFRTLLLQDFQEFLQLCAETDPDELLPPPKAAAKLLKQKTLQFVQDWYNEFKDGYKLLIIAYNFLKECKQVNFEDLEARSIAERARDTEIRQRAENALIAKVEKAMESTRELSAEIQSVTEQVENGLRLLQPHPEVYFDKSDFNRNRSNSAKFENEQISAGVQPVSDQELLRHHGITSRNIAIEVTLTNDSSVAIEENDDTTPILENIKDLHSQIVCHLQPAIAKVLQVFTKAGCEEKMKRVIDLKQLLESTLERLNELKILPKLESSSKCNTESDDDDENDEFEEVEEKEGIEEIIPVHRRAEYGLDAIPSTSKSSGNISDQRHWALKMKLDDIIDPTTRLANLSALHKKLSSLDNFDFKSSGKSFTSSDNRGVHETGSDKNRAELLAKAPKKNFDIDLYHWEDEKLEAPSVIRFDSLHKFWQPRENETSEFQDQEALAALRQRVIDFSGEFQPVEKACRAPLPSGKLCPRMDRKKCPFHGPIVPRDEMGNVIVSTDSDNKPSTSNAGNINSVPDWQDPVLLREIEAQTGLDLKIPEKGKRKKKHAETKLTDLKVTQNTTRKRLEKKVMNKNSVKRVAQSLDRLDHKKFRDKYGDQWNYTFNL